MSKPDRDLLNQVNEIWDARSSDDDDHTAGDAGGFGEVINALHRADIEANPSIEFRRRLRQRLLGDIPKTAGNSGEFTFETGPAQTSSPIQLQGSGQEKLDTKHRRWWLSHAGELAAIILILVVAVAGVAWWQSDDAGDASLPGATGDDKSAETEPLVTPAPDSPGVWTGLTFDEAQAVTPFELLMPPDVPDGYEIGEIVVVEESAREADQGNQLPPRDDGEPWTYATVELFPVDGTETPPIAITQRNGLQHIPLDVAPSVELSGGRDVQPRPVETHTEDRDIDGIDVRYTVQDVGEGVQNVLFLWEQDGLSIAVASSNQPREREALTPDIPAMERIVEALILERENDDVPPEWPDLRIAPDDEVEDLPRPEQHRDLTLDEARELVPFELIDPGEAHEGYDLADVDVLVPPVGDHFNVTYVLVSREHSERSFPIYQQNSRLAIPDMPPEEHANEPGSEAAGIEGLDQTQEEIEIDGLLVTRLTYRNIEGDQITTHAWYQDGVGFTLTALTSLADDSGTQPQTSVIPEEDIHAIVTSIIETRTSDEGPPEPDIQEPPPEAREAHPDGGREQVAPGEAQSRVPFELVDIALLPGELVFVTAEIARFEGGNPVGPDHPELENPNRVSSHFTSPPQSDPPQIIQVIQTTDTIPNPDGEMIEVSGHPVERVSGERGGAFETAWIWEMDGVEYGILVTTVNADGHESIDAYEDNLLITGEDVMEIIARAMEQ